MVPWNICGKNHCRYGDGWHWRGIIDSCSPSLSLFLSLSCSPAFQAITQVGRIDRNATTAASSFASKEHEPQEAHELVEEEEVVTEETLLQGAMREMSVQQDQAADEPEDGAKEVHGTQTTQQKIPEQQQQQEPNDEADDDSDDGGWITPSNVKRVKERQWNARNGGSQPVDQGPIDVACITTDFAMQVRLFVRSFG